VREEDHDQKKKKQTKGTKREPSKLFRGKKRGEDNHTIRKPRTREHDRDNKRKPDSQRENFGRVINDCTWGSRGPGN